MQQVILKEQKEHVLLNDIPQHQAIYAINQSNNNEILGIIVKHKPGWTIQSNATDKSGKNWISLAQLISAYIKESPHITFHINVHAKTNNTKEIAIIE